MSTTLSPAEKQKGNRSLSIRDYLKSDSLIAEIGKALPKHMSPERMARVALTCLTRVPKLAECTPESFMQCLFSLSQWGLEPDGRHAHLIPYGRECTLIVDYKGLVALAYRSGKVKNIHADVVRVGDVFKYNLGIVEAHTPWAFRSDAGKPASAGEVYAVYCIVTLDADLKKCEVMTRDDVEAIRKRSKAGGSGPWVSDWNEMAKKTVFRRVSKWLPLSAEVVEAMDSDDDRVIDAVSSTRIENRSEALADNLAGMLTQSHEADDTNQASDPQDQ